jgi:transcriptional regulator with XRE-family HTH domain
MSKISAQRKKKGLSIRGLARAAGVDPSTVSRIERGQWPKERTALLLAKAVPINRLFV